MLELKNKLEVFSKIYNFIQENFPNYYFSVEHGKVEEDVFMISGVSLTLWDKNPEKFEELHRLEFKLGELLALLNQNGLSDLTMDDIESFLEVESLFSNQMDKILPKYESGWDVSKDGLKLKEETEYHSWAEVEQFIKDRATWYDFETIMTI